VDLQRLNASQRAASTEPLIETNDGPNLVENVNRLALAV
jgi:hypothetical protein